MSDPVLSDKNDFRVYNSEINVTEKNKTEKGQGAIPSGLASLRKWQLSKDPE